jgi:hypothetical protein
MWKDQASSALYSIHPTSVGCYNSFSRVLGGQQPSYGMRKTVEIRMPIRLPSIEELLNAFNEHRRVFLTGAVFGITLGFFIGGMALTIDKVRLELVKEERDQHRRKIDAQSKEIDGLNEHLRKSEEDLALLRANLNDTTRNRDEVIKEYNEFKASFEQLKRNNISESTEELKRVTKENTRLSNQLSELQRRNNSLQTENKNLNNTLSSMNRRRSFTVNEQAKIILKHLFKQKPVDNYNYDIVSKTSLDVGLVDYYLEELQKLGLVTSPRKSYWELTQDGRAYIVEHRIAE